MTNETLRSILLIYVNEKKKRKHIAKKEIQEIFKKRRKEREILLW